LGGVWGRARALHDSLREPADERAIRRVLIADTWWGIAAVLWLASGLWRLIGHTEKSASYYLASYAFYTKMGMFVTILALEIWPMITLIRWRMGKAQPHARDVGRMEVISYIECALVIGIVLAAVSMARGFGMVALTPPAVGADSLVAFGDVVPPPLAPAKRDTTATAEPARPAVAAPATLADVDVLTHEIAMPLVGVDPMKLTSNFEDLRAGLRRHHALDIMAARRTPVLSAAGGRVLKLFTSKAGGLMVYAADSAERFILMYAHLDAYAPGLRDSLPLTRGQLIGYVGFTGNASPNAPHLHFAIARSEDVRQWSKGTPIDPLPVLQRAWAGNATGPSPARASPR